MEERESEKIEQEKGTENIMFSNMNYIICIYKYICVFIHVHDIKAEGL